MAITKMRFSQFTAFERLDFIACPGINVLVGANGTGKTHLMKVAYSACDISKTKADFAEKLVSVFMPSSRNLGRLVRRQQTSSRDLINCHIEISRDDALSIQAYFPNLARYSSDATVSYVKEWCDHPVDFEHPRVPSENREVLSDKLATTRLDCGPVEIAQGLFCQLDVARR